MYFWKKNYYLPIFGIRAMQLKLKTQYFYILWCPGHMNDDNLKHCLPNWCGYWGLLRWWKLYFNGRKCIAQLTITNYNFPNRSPRPRKCLFGAFHQVDNNFPKFDRDEVQEFNLILFSSQTPYGNYKFP